MADHRTIAAPQVHPPPLEIDVPPRADHSSAPRRGRLDVDHRRAAGPILTRSAACRAVAPARRLINLTDRYGMQSQRVSAFQNFSFQLSAFLTASSRHFSVEQMKPTGSSV